MACPGVSSSPVPGVTYYYLFKHGVFPGDSVEPLPADDGQGPRPLGHAGRHRPDDRPADRDDAVHRQGQRALPRDHARRGRSAASSSATTTPELRDRPRRPDLLVPDDRLHEVRRRDRPDRHRRRDHRSPVPERGEQPRARAPDRRAAGQVRHRRAHRRLRDARQGLAAPGARRGDRRPDRRRDLPAPPLPLPRPRRGDRPRRSTPPSCTGRSCSSASR